MNFDRIELLFTPEKKENFPPKNILNCPPVKKQRISRAQQYKLVPLGVLNFPENKKSGTGVFLKVSLRNRLLHPPATLSQKNNQETTSEKKRERPLSSEDLEPLPKKNALALPANSTHENLDRTIHGVALELILVNFRVNELRQVAAVNRAFLASIKAPAVVAAVINRNCICIDPTQLPGMLKICSQFITKINLESLFSSQKGIFSPQMTLDRIFLEDEILNCPNLKEIDLTGFTVRGKVFDSLHLVGTATSSHLTHVSLTEDTFLQSRFEEKVEVIWPTLTEIVYSNGLSKNYSRFNTWARRCVNLNTLRFPLSNYDDEVVTAMALYYPGLKVLEISGGKLDRGIIDIAKNCKNIATLILNKNQISLPSLHGFVANLESPSLQELDISFNGKFFIEDIVDSVTKITSLKKLSVTLGSDIWRTPVEAEGTVQKTLTHLALLNSYLENSVASVIAHAFPSIQILDLSEGKYLTDTFIEVITSECTQINSLDLRGNTEFSEPLTGFVPSLTKLNVDRCTALPRSFFKSIPTVFPNLCQLSIQSNPKNMTVCGSYSAIKSAPSLYENSFDIITNLPSLVTFLPSNPEIEEYLDERKGVKNKGLEYTFRNTQHGYHPKFW